MPQTLRLALRAGTLTVALLAATAPGAFAATLTNAGGTLGYTGADVDNDVTFTRTGANEVLVVRDPTDDSDPITATGCTENTAGESYTCAGVTRVAAAGNGGADELDGSALSDIPITLNGGAGDDELDGGGVVDAISGSDGDDVLTGGAGGETINGGPGNDTIDAGLGDDTLNGDDGDDTLSGDEDNDTVNGGTGSDRLSGDDGNDSLDAGEGNDVLSGGTGNDQLSAEEGDDQLLGDAGDDELFGGRGFDTAYGQATGSPPAPLNVTLDDNPNDQLSGAPGEVDNVHADVDAVEAELTAVPGTPASGNDTFIGSGGPNTLSGGRGNDLIDGNIGNDVLSGGDGDDTIRARDGFADFVSCGAGNDTAEVDTVDRTVECETILTVDVGNANDVPEDRPPTVTLDAPAAGALLPSTGPSVMTATATDDVGVAQVLFIDDDRIVCADATAPYTCDYRPRGEDVGRNTLVATAIDTAQQTASITRTFRVDRFTPVLTGRVTPSRDTRAPFRFRTVGRLRLPAAVAPANGCAEGVVSIQVKSIGKTISTRRAELRPDCSFRSSVSFASRRRFSRSGRLRFELRFTGNEILKRSLAVARNIRTRGR